MFAIGRFQEVTRSRLKGFFSFGTSGCQVKSQPHYISIDKGMFDGRKVASLVSSNVSNGNTVVLRKNGHELKITRGKSDNELVINLAASPVFLSFLEMFDLIGALVACGKQVDIFCGHRDEGKYVAGLIRSGKIINKIDQAAARYVEDKQVYFLLSGKVFVLFS